MVCLISIFIVFLVLLLTRYRFGTYITGNTVFTFFWCLILALSSFGLYGLYVPSTYVYVISFVSVIVFNLPFLVGRKVKKYSVSANDIQGSISLKYLVLGHIVAYYFAFPYLKYSIEFVAKNGFSAIRGVELEDIGQSTYIALGFQWICLPFFTITIIFCAIKIAMQQTNKLLLVLALLDTFTYAIIYGGRYIILKFLFYIFAAVIIVSGGKILQIIKKHLKIIILGALGISLLVYLTSLRSLSNMTFLGNMVGYYVGSLSLLSELVGKNLQGAYLGYGHMTFGFIINLFMAALKLVFGIEYMGSDTIFTSFAGNYHFIGNNIKTNALPTALYAFILDYGKEFFFVGVLILAIFSAVIEKRFYKKQTVRNFAIYLFVLYNVFDTILVYDYISPGTCMTFVFLVLLTKNKANERDIKKE